MNALEIKDLKKSYGDFTLDNLSLTLPSGCIMGLIGENGAGKSTTLRLIMDMIRKDGGQITILGQDHQSGCRLIREEVGVVLDEPGIPDCLTALQAGKVMARIFRQWDDVRYSLLLKELSLPENKPFKDLSRGMKMKLSIAVALSHGAKLLLLDEPTSGLDPVVRDQVVEMFCDFTRDENHSILISSHIVSDLEKLCDYIAFLHQGRLLLCEEKDRLLEEYGLLHCPLDQLGALPEGALVRKRVTPYGAEALVLRDRLPAGLTAGAISIEDLFVFMVKEV